MKVACLVDGFNLYHSLCNAIEDGAPAEVKWLNIRSLAASLLEDFFKNAEAHVSKVFYFTSIASYRSDNAHVRHRAFIRALEADGIETVYGYFKEKEVRCEAKCRGLYTAHVEKKTDVHVALKLLELFHLGECDAALIISGDGDLVPAVQTAKKLFPEQPVAIAFPYKRWHPELSQQTSLRTKLGIDIYKAHVFPDVVNLPNGKMTHIPKEWKAKK